MLHHPLGGDGLPPADPNPNPNPYPNPNPNPNPKQVTGFHQQTDGDFRHGLVEHVRQQIAFEQQQQAHWRKLLEVFTPIETPLIQTTWVLDDVLLKQHSTDAELLRKSLVKKPDTEKELV